MKRAIRCNYTQPDIDTALSLIMDYTAERRVYGKFMNIVSDKAEAYLQGVLDFAEVSNTPLPGLEMLWELIQTEGIDVVRKQCLAR